MKGFRHFFIQRLGIDRAIGATTATQLIRFITGPITMVLLIRYLNPAEQGYFYAFGGVMGIQVFLEAGFAVSIAQFAAKEFAGLRFTKNRVLTGKSANLSRLRSIFRKANKYYTVMAGVLTVGLGVGGYLFFSLRPDDGVEWQIPWIIVSICAGVSFLLTPFWAILEGCNRVADIASYRMVITIVGFVFTALGFILSQNIWVVVWSSVAGLLASYAYLAWKWRAFVWQICRRYYEEHQVAWFQEIWGLQWRIAASWGAGYFLNTFITPMVFATAGPIAGGQMGMTFQLSRMGAAIGSSWTATKVPHFGMLSARRDFAELDKIWKKSAMMGVLVSIACQVALIVAYMLLTTQFPRLHERLLPLPDLLLLGVAHVALSVWLVCAHYTRGFRREPYVLLTIATAVVFLAAGYTASAWIGTTGVTLAFSIVNCVAALVAIPILLNFRKTYAR